MNPYNDVQQAINTIRELQQDTRKQMTILKTQVDELQAKQHLQYEQLQTICKKLDTFVSRQYKMDRGYQ